MSCSPKMFAVIVAAGVGSRMQQAVPKQYLDLCGQPVIRYSVDAFLACAFIEKVFIAVSPTDDKVVAMLGKVATDARVEVLYCGGQTRQATVINALLAIQNQCQAQDRVLVHDAARPGITPELIARLLPYASDMDGALFALPLADTLKRALPGKIQTESREGLYRAQTPQMFAHATLLQALQTTDSVTDEAQAMELQGYAPHLVMGHWRNQKLTIPEDFELLSLVLRKDK